MDFALRFKEALAKPQFVDSPAGYRLTHAEESASAKPTAQKQVSSPKAATANK